MGGQIKNLGQIAYDTSGAGLLSLLTELLDA